MPLPRFSLRRIPRLKLPRIKLSRPKWIDRMSAEAGDPGLDGSEPMATERRRLLRMPKLSVPKLNFRNMRMPRFRKPNLSMPTGVRGRVAPRQLALMAFGTLALLLLIPAFIGAVQTGDLPQNVEVASTGGEVRAIAAPQGEAVAIVEGEAAALPADAAALPAEAEVVIVAPEGSIATDVQVAAQPVVVEAAPVEGEVILVEAEAAPIAGEVIIVEGEAVAAEVAPEAVVEIAPEAAPEIVVEAKRPNAVARFFAPLGEWIFGKDEVAVTEMAVVAQPEAAVEVKRPNAVARFFAPVGRWIFGSSEEEAAEMALVAASAEAPAEAAAPLEAEVVVEEKRPNVIVRFFTPLTSWIWGDSEEAALADAASDTDPLAGVDFDGCVFVSKFEQPAQGDLIPVEGWSITLLDSTAITVETGLTSPTGELLFSNLPYGAYTVTEETRDGWTPVTATSVAISLTTNSCPQVDFINEQIPPTVCIQATLPGAAVGVEVRATSAITGGYQPDPEISDSTGTVRFILPFDDPTVPGTDYELCATGADNVTIWCTTVTVPTEPGVCATAGEFTTPQDGVILASTEVAADSAAQSCSALYSVRRGDGLYWIAQQHGVTPKEILAANPRVRNRYNLFLYRGEQICIP